MTEIQEKLSFVASIPLFCLLVFKVFTALHWLPMERLGELSLRLPVMFLNVCTIWLLFISVPPSALIR